MAVRAKQIALGNGLEADGSGNLQIDVSDVAGTGLEADGSTSIRVATAAAGDGLNGGGGSALSVDAGDGLQIGGGIGSATAVNIDVSDFAGAGLEDDGSENLRIATAAAGDGLDGGGGSALSVDAGDGLQIGGGIGAADAVNIDVSDFAGAGLEDDGSENLRIATAAAGDGLDGGGGSALSVDAGDGLQIGGGVGAADAVNIDVSDFAGAGLEDDGSENLRISTAAAGSGLTGGGGSALAIDLTSSLTFGTGAAWSFTAGSLSVTGTPTAATDVPNKSYVDSVATGLFPIAAVRLATADNLDDNSDISGSPTYDDTGGTSARGQITATLAVSGTFTVDGVAVVSGDRILIKNEGDLGGLGADANGIYVATISGTSLTLDRAEDQDEDAEVTAGTCTFVAEGTANGDELWCLTSDDPITVGGTSGSDLTWAQIGGPGSIVAGAGVSFTGSTINVGDAGRGVQVNADDLEIDASEIAGNGLKENGTSSWVLDIEPADFAGTGLEDDGSDNLRIATAAAGDGLDGGGGSALSVDAGDGLQIGGGVGAADAVNIDVSDFAGTGLEDDGSENLRIATAAAGDGLDGGGGSALSVDAGDGLQIGGGVGAADAVNIDVSDFAGTGLEDDGSENLRISTAAAGDGITGGGGSALAVDPADDSVSVSASGLVAAQPVRDNKDMTASVTASDDDQATVTTIAKAPGGDSYIQVAVNGILYEVGDGTKTGVDCFFSGDGGTTARAFSAIVAGDTLHWVGSVAGFELDATDRIDLFYNNTTV